MLMSANFANVNVNVKCYYVNVNVNVNVNVCDTDFVLMHSSRKCCTAAPSVRAEQGSCEPISQFKAHMREREMAQKALELLLTAHLGSSVLNTVFSQVVCLFVNFPQGQGRYRYHKPYT